MKTVFIVVEDTCEYECNGYKVLGVFTEEAKAKAFVDKQQNNWHLLHLIEWEIDKE